MNWQQTYLQAKGLLRKGYPEDALRMALQTIGQIPEEVQKEAMPIYDFIYDAGIKAQRFEFLVEMVPVINQLKGQFYGEDSLTYATGLNNLGFVHHMLGQYEQAIANYEACLKIYQLHARQLSNNYASTLYSLSDAYIQLGQYDHAIAAVHESANIYWEILGAEHDQYIRTRYHLAKIYHQRGRYAEAVELLRQIIEVNARLFGKQHLAYLDPMQTLVRVLQDTGEYEEAENLLLEGKQIIEQDQGTDNLDYAMITHNLGELWNQMGRYDKGAEILEISLVLKQKFFGAQHEEYARTLNNIAVAYKKNGQSEDAESAYLSSKNIIEQTLGVDHPDYGHILSNLGYLYVEMGKYTEATEILLESLKIDEALLGKDHPTIANTYYLLGYLSFMRKEFELANKFYLLSLDIYHRTPKVNPKSLASALFNYGFFLDYSEQDPDDAGKNYYLGFIYMIRFIKAQLPALSEREKQALTDQFSQMISLYAGYVFEHYQENATLIQDLYSFYLMLKGLLGYSMRHMRDTIHMANDDQLNRDFDAWLESRKQLAIAYKKEMLPKEIAKWEESANLLERRLSKQSHIFAQNQALEMINWKQVQQVLQPHEAAIEMIRISRVKRSDAEIVTTYLLLIILPEKYGQQVPELLVIDDAETMETTYLQAYRQSLFQEIPAALQARQWIYDHANPWSEVTAAELFEKYWGKLQNFMKPYVDITAWYFSPDGVYHLINVEALYDPNNQHYVLDQVEVHLLTSTRDLLDEGEMPGDTEKRAVLIGAPDFDRVSEGNGNNTAALEQTLRWIDLPGIGGIAPLPGTRQEMEEVGRLLEEHHWHVETWLQEEASVEQLFAVKQPTILHIATHGYFMLPPETGTGLGMPRGLLTMDNQHSIKDESLHPLLLSGLLLAGAQQAFSEVDDPEGEDKVVDGIFSAYDASNLRLSGTQLVVLSACETALGPVRYGEGIYGLQRAFRMAGAKTLICSLWRVSDAATEQLMVSFYQHWLKSGDIHGAFRQAQQELRRHYPDPYYWGAFVVIG